MVGTTTIYASIIRPLILKETVSWKPVSQLVRVRNLIKDNLHDRVRHEVIVTTSSDKEISLQELLELLYNHLVPSLFLILLLLTLRV